MLENPLRPIVGAWKEKIRSAERYKWSRFGEDAAECQAFFNGPHDFLFKKGYGRTSKGFVVNSEDDPTPTFGMTVNKAAECVALFGPTLYHKNPTRKVNPRKTPMLPIEAMGDPNDPMVQQQWMMLGQQSMMLSSTDQARSTILESYLNYTPTALALKDECRSAIDEALIKGMGVLWTETYRPPGLQISLVGSFYDTVDNLVVDPDMESIKTAKWIARRCIHPVWEFEAEYGLPPGTVRGNLESLSRQSDFACDDDLDYDRRRGTSNDLIVYWKIYSKMGVGARLKGVPSALRDELDAFGDYCYLVITEELPYPANLPPQLLESPEAQQALSQALAWPTPFWADDTWPFTPIQFHPIPRCVWPMSHLKPALGELKFLDWAYSFLASKIRIACRDFIAIKQAAGEELKKAILEGTDYTLLEIQQHHGNTIAEVVQFLQHPAFNGDIYRVIQAIEANFEKRTGLTELIYGQSESQFRSAAEAEVKNQNLKIRPDDMAARVEEAMTEVARKEALCARWHITGQDVLPIMGPLGAQWWSQLVESSDPNMILHQLEYRIEAGSTRKPNRERDAQNMRDAMQTLFPFLSQYATTTGNVGPVNKLLSDWARSIDLDADGYLLAPPPPPPPMPQRGEEAPPEEAPIAA